MRCAPLDRKHAHQGSTNAKGGSDVGFISNNNAQQCKSAEFLRHRRIRPEMHKAQLERLRDRSDLRVTKNLREERDAHVVLLGDNVRVERVGILIAEAQQMQLVHDLQQSQSLLKWESVLNLNMTR